MNKKIITIMIIGSIGIIGLIALINEINKERLKEKVEYEKLNFIADSLMQEADSLFRKNDFENAKSIIELIMKQETPSGKECILFDSAQKVFKSIEKYLLWQGDEKYKEILATMPDYEYDMLSKNELFKSYVFHPYLDSLIIQTLYKYRYKRIALVKERQRLKRIEEIEEAKAAATMRKEFEITLRNIFLDMGFDIKVKVTGKYNTRLILSFPLFNDVWFRKFKTNGNFDAWHTLGFKRVDLKDGYEYHKYYYWK